MTESERDSLLWAVKNGDVAEVEKHLQKFDVNRELTGGRNPLHFAADFGQCKVVKLLLEKKAKIDLPDKHGITALLAAIYEGHTEVVELLVAKGADKSGRTPDGKSYLEVAESEDIKKMLK